YPGLPCSLGYQVCWGVAGVDPTIQACSSDLPRDARNFTIAGLRRRTNYTVQVMARFDGDVMSPPVQLVALTAEHDTRQKASQQCLLAGVPKTFLLADERRLTARRHKLKRFLCESSPFLVRATLFQPGQSGKRCLPQGVDHLLKVIPPTVS
ncbi:unnamed protein product, partial [Timema podura]|nr:unnamed protein product [Timema podura]